MRQFASVFYAMQQLLFPIALAAFALGAYLGDSEVMLFGVLGAFLSNVIYSCYSVRDKMVFLLLHGGVFLFLLTRPLVALVDHERTWHLSSDGATQFALTLIFLSLFFLRLGVAAFYALASRGKLFRIQNRLTGFVKDTMGVSSSRFWIFSESNVQYVRIASLILFAVCLIGAFVVGAQRLNYMQGRVYEEYYLASMGDYTSSYLGDLEMMLPFFLCIYLATLPKKKLATVVLVFYIATTLPLLIIGARTDFVMAVVFAGVYYLIRDSLDGKGTWIGQKEKIIVGFGVPLGILAMGAVNYLRADSSSLGSNGLLWLLGDALYKQGVTFNVLGYAYEHTAEIAALGFKCYSLDPLFHNITQGFIGQTFLNLPLLPTVNSAELALNGHSFGNALSYFAHPNYLGGEGYGSCYLLELNADFGYMGVIVFSFFFGMIGVVLSRLVGRNWFAGTVGLLAMFYVFHIARGTVLEWIAFVFKTRFWMAIVILVVFASLLAFVSLRYCVPSARRGDKAPRVNLFGIPVFAENEMTKTRSGFRSIRKDLMACPSVLRAGLEHKESEFRR